MADDPGEFAHAVSGGSGLPKEAEDFVLACVEMCGRFGATNLRVGFSDEEDGDPQVWWCAVDSRHGHYATAAFNPVDALWRMVEDSADGGHCTHCHKVTGVVRDAQAHEMPKGEAIGGVCWYAYDPERKTFRRSCEGVAP